MPAQISSDRQKLSDAQKSTPKSTDGQKSIQNSKDNQKIIQKSPDGQKSIQNSKDNQKSTQNSTDSQKSAQKSTDVQELTPKSTAGQKSTQQPTNVQKPSANGVSAWFNTLHVRPDATCRLICFPWCGGGSQFYARWGADFNGKIEVVGVQLPGRESRVKEPLVSDLDKVIAPLCDEIVKHYSDKPFAFFGHSMGSLLCYEAAVYLRDKHSKQPRHIFFSGDYAPHSRVRKERMEGADYKAPHEATDTELIERITKHGGTPKMFLENTDFMVNTFLPTYRNDLKMAAKYYRSMKSKKALTCCVTAIDGDRDVNHHISEFSELATGKFQQMKLPGYHFYLLKEDNSKRLRDVITKALI